MSPAQILVVALLAILISGQAVAIAHLARNRGKIARLHVTLQFELSSGLWDDAEADIADLERIGGSWPALSYMVRQTIAAGRSQSLPPPAVAKRFDEDSQSYVAVE